MATKAHGRILFWEGASLWVLGTRPGEGETGDLTQLRRALLALLSALEVG